MLILGLQAKAIKTKAAKKVKAIVKASEGDETTRTFYNLLKEQKDNVKVNLKKLESHLEQLVDNNPEQFISTFIDQEFPQILESSPRIKEILPSCDSAYSRKFRNSVMDLVSKLSEIVKSLN